MKTRKLSPLLVLIASAMLLISCDKDKTPPTINLLGDNPMTLYIGDAYTEYGATAIDDKDGDISAAVEVSSDVNTDLKGNYKVTYRVADAEGNSTEEIRYVFVVNAVDYLMGEWTVEDNKVGPSGPPIQETYTETITASGEVNNRFWLTTFGSHINGSVYIDRVTGTQCQVPQQEVNCGTPAATRRFLGTATILDSNSIVVNYTELVGSQNFNCSANYSRL